MLCPAAARGQSGEEGSGGPLTLGGVGTGARASRLRQGLAHRSRCSHPTMLVLLPLPLFSVVLLPELALPPLPVLVLVVVLPLLVELPPVFVVVLLPVFAVVPFPAA